VRREAIAASWGVLAAAVCLLAAAGPARAEPDPEPVLEAGVTRDPWEGFNRRIFWFNLQLDRFVLEPVAIGWDAVLPDLVQRSVRNVYDHARFPILLVNDALQLKPEAMAQDIGRFAINTVWGVMGIWDAAALVDLPANDEDFGQTLGYWGVPSGPYLVLPFFGPSSPRDTVGLAGDAAIGYGAWFAAGIPIYVSASITGVDVVNRRSLLIETIREEKAQAFDFYVFVRNAYIQNRERKVRDAVEGVEEPDDEGDLYYLDEESDEELYYPEEEGDE
jgi:phospholipid-binding lipoprotein MlaA